MISGLYFFIFRRKLTIRSSSQRQYKDWMRWLRYPHVNLRLTCASRNRAEQFKLLWVFQSAKVRCLSANLCGLLKLIFWGYLALLFCVLFSCLYLALYYLHWGPLFFLWLLQEKRKRKLLKHVKYNWKSIIKKIIQWLSWRIGTVESEEEGGLYQQFQQPWRK